MIISDVYNTFQTLFDDFDFQSRARPRNECKLITNSAEAGSLWSGVASSSQSNITLGHSARNNIM